MIFLMVAMRIKRMRSLTTFSVFSKKCFLIGKTQFAEAMQDILSVYLEKVKTYNKYFP